MKKHITIATLFTLFPSIASAHPGHGLDGAYAGFIHPLTGWDHLLMMLAIGLWAAKLGGKSRWQLPVTFLLALALGAILGLVGLSFSGVETAIAASLVAMGLLLVINFPVSVKTRICIIALFATMHGMAHGAVLSANHSYAPLAGMLLVTALLHAMGFFIGTQRYQWLQYLGAGLTSSMLLLGGYLLFVS
jgi:urease accessory protein